MEAEQSQPTGGERSGGPEQSVSEPPLQGSLSQSPSPQHHRLFPSRSLQTPGRHPLHRQPKRGDLERHYPRLQQQQQQPPSAFQLPGSADPERVTGTTAWQFSDSPGPSGEGVPSSSSSSTSRLHPQLVPPPHAGKEAQEGVPKRERKPQKPGKYVCQYCGRPCAKPSVLQKHIRSHTGERPYPCTPCGFSFKTKSNLYKHRKSHAHRIKAGLASGREGYTQGGPEGGQSGVEQEEQTEGESTDSEDETGQRTSSPTSSFSLDPYGGLAPRKSAGAEQPEDSHAVKQRLAMRLSERKKAPVAVPDDPASSFLSPGSKGSTESGYFSRSESSEQQQGSPPSTNTKSYAEIILGKYGRMGQQQRNAPPQQQQQPPSSSTQEEKSIPFSVPKTQVIEHITKLITINEAVVDTSEIDSVKPRRTSLSRRGSLESPKTVGQKEPFLFDPKGEFPSTSSSIGCMGVGVVGEPLYPQVSDPAFLAGLSSTVPLLRSHSMPSSADPSAAAGSSHSFRLSHSFDERQALATETRAGTLLPPHHRMLRRQPAIEVPLGGEFIPEKPSSSCSSTYTTDPAQKHRRGPQLYECEACGACYKKQDNYETHRRYYCPVHPPQAPERESLPSANREDRPQMMHHTLGASAAAVRKRRKEKSLGDEEEPPAFEPSPASVTSSSSYSTSPYSGIPSRPLEESRQVADILGKESSLGAPVQSEQDRRTTGKISVIQHTSSFEKQETASGERQESEEKGRGSTALEQHQQPKPPTFSRLVRQSNIQVPEILVTEEPDPEVVLVTPSASTTKEPEKTEEFQWPQRSQSLSQLPAEKLPPKKKRLRLAEAAQSSGESSFESISLPRSPSQESSVSHASSRSASFEETGKPESEYQLTATRASHVTHMLTVPSGPHQHHQPHREMRRSASEQAPTSAQHPAQIAEARSKSFDYGSLSPQRSSTAWRERRKCLLVRQATLGELEPEEQPAGRSIKAVPQVCLGYHSPTPPATEPGPAYHSTILSTDPLTKPLQLFPPPPSCEHAFPLQSLLPPPPPPALSQGQAPQLFPAPGISEVLSTQVLPHSFLQASPQLHPAQLHLGEHLGLPLQYRSLLPLQYPTVAAPALFLPLPPGLALQPTREPFQESKPVASPDPQAPGLLQPPRPVISPSSEQLRPVVPLVVPIRLQSRVPTYGRAIYTTLSQVLVTRAQESAHSAVVICKVEEDRPRTPYLKIPTPELKMYHPTTLPLETGVGMAMGEGHWPSTAGGNKRMLSPAGSLELSVEAQRQQKRVKEEEDEEEGGEEEEEREEKKKAVQREEASSPASPPMAVPYTQHSPRSWSLGPRNQPTPRWSSARWKRTGRGRPT
ncbi:Transcription factor HIVEP3 [Acipenser ruthenus]|uniref:Transcription factor HIVEP3 n=1 Tax=Acipenser ruthenus TaxID=7906 RepID=A0A662YIU2_ACIRT|nr:Transcription factor HIVEP3 [Acipenser ruthenus]